MDILNKLNSSIEGEVVCRFAPSPTGFLHVGGIRTALYNYLFAKKNKGTFILRVEDTDQKRFVSSAEDYIKNSLEWCGLMPDYSPWQGGPHSPYKQSERDYSKEIKFLLDNGMAYYAFDTQDELTSIRSLNKNFAYDVNTRMSMRNSISLPKDEVDRLLSTSPYVIRFKTPENKTIIFTDLIREEISFNTTQTDDKVLVKSNGIPTYHMASVCDDHNMGVTHVIRGEEWLPSTPLHILLYDAFGWNKPKFAHLPLLLNPNGIGKLSKRKSLSYDFPVFPIGGEGEDNKGKMVKYKGFKDEGYDPKALLNFLLLLGWNPGHDVEIMTIEDMIDSFSLDRVHKCGARFDMNKAKWINSQYLKNTPNDMLLPYITLSDDRYSDDKVDMIVSLAKERVDFKQDLNQIVDLFFDTPVINAKKINDNYKIVMSRFINEIDSIDFDKDTIKDTIFKICESTGIKMGKVMPGLRMSLVGGISGPDLMTTMEILGKYQVKNRIKKSLVLCVPIDI